MVKTFFFGQWKSLVVYSSIFIYRNETFVTKIFGSSVIDLTVRDHKTLTHTDIGDASFHVSEYIDEGRSFDGWLPLVPPGTGEIHIQAEIVAK